MLTAVMDFLLQEYRTHPMARFALGVVIYGLALWLVDIVSGGMPVLLWVLLVIGLAILGGYYLHRTLAALKRHVLWHLRRRLIVTYIFIAVIPLVLILVLAWLAAVMLNGQFAAYLVANRFRNKVDELRQVNRVVAHEAHLSQPKSPTELEDQLRRFYVQELSTHAASYPGLEIAVRVGPEKEGFYLGGRALHKIPIIPKWFHREEFAGVVNDGGRLFIRSVDQGKTSAGLITMVLSEPFTSNLLDVLGSGIGPVRIAFNPGKFGIPSVPLTGGVATGQPPVSSPQTMTIQSKSVAVPRPANFLDITVSGASTLNPVRWGGAREERVRGPVFVYVTSRFSILTDQLLGTLGRYSHVYVNLFLLITVIFLAVEIVSLLVGIRLTRTVTTTVDKLYGATERIKSGDLSHRVGMSANDQLSSLGQAFDNMTDSLQRLMREAHEKTVLAHDLQLAREVQQHLFPSETPEVPGLKLYGVCRPARGVSGDYYDFLPIGSERLGIVLGDVSGKGVSAALIMSAVQSIIRTRLYSDSSSDGRLDSARLSTAKFFGQLNHQMYENTPAEKYATCFYALYDAVSRQVIYTNAGHPPPLVFRNGAVTKLEVGGTPLGLVAPVTYREADVTLKPGDLLVVFSDGLTEAANTFDEQFGIERLTKAIQRAQNYSLENLVHEIYGEIEDWTGSKVPQDDMTLIVAQATE